MKKTEFLTNSREVRIFICGPTVYDYSHLGHARIFVFYDIMARYFIFRDLHPIVIINITDIDPKISYKAQTQGMQRWEVATKFIEELYIDMSSLGINTTFNFARASDYVGVAREIVQKLLTKKIAYSTGGKIFLDTARLSSFGRLSKMTKNELDNARLDLDSGKRNPSDILLWNSTVDVNEEYFSETLGSGMPWWHLQDSSIAISNFNGAYDIHGGAVDLIYPHHESHLAQLRALTSHQRPVKYWTHVGLLTLGANKMSKALDNAISIRDILKEYNSNILRLYMISNHYRRPLEFSLSKLEDFRQLDDTICTALIDRAGDTHSHDLMKMNTRNDFNKFIKCLEDDFDTPRALEIMKNSTNSIEASVSLKHMVNIFGLRY